MCFELLGTSPTVCMQMPGQERAGAKSQTQCCLTLRMSHDGWILTPGPTLRPPLYSQLLYDAKDECPIAVPKLFWIHS